MGSLLLSPPAHLPPTVALQLSQQAPIILQNTPSSIASYSLSSLWSTAESPELWLTYENLMLSCLRTGDEASAHLCLERLTTRFGAENERLMALRGIFQEAVAEDDAALKQVLDEYDSILDKDPSNMPVSKRRIALLKTLNKITEAITALNEFLDASPTDAEAWAELADLYISQGLYQQGLFALEEVSIITPNAWNMQAKLGEVNYMAASSSDNADKYLAESFRRFCRSIELCDDYLRGYYGLKLTSDKLLSSFPQNNRQSKNDSSLPIPSRKTVERLNEVATAKLSEIIRLNGSGDRDYQGYDAAEIIAAKAPFLADHEPSLLDKSTPSITR